MNQLPQNLLARAVIRAVDAKYTGKDIDGVRLYSCKAMFGVSLGDYIIINKDHLTDIIIKHEYGHSLQSRKLGWLYLLIVGVPSITMNILTRVKLLKAENYYKRWPENWADKLGGVTR